MLLIISGAFGVFRTDLRKQLGGFRRGAIGETWTWWCVCTGTCASKTRSTGSISLPIPFAGRK